MTNVYGGYFASTESVEKRRKNYQIGGIVAVLWPTTNHGNAFVHETSRILRFVITRKESLERSPDDSNCSPPPTRWNFDDAPGNVGRISAS